MPECLYMPIWIIMKLLAVIDSFSHQRLANKNHISKTFHYSMLQSFETTGPPPPGHSGEFNTDQVLKNINSPAPGANCSVKTPVQPGFSIPKL